ncbi:MAG: PIN domain-containing protein [Chloroflexota bacterium]
MNYFLDTNICIYIMNYRPTSIIEKLIQLEPQEVGISAIVVSELGYGVAKSQRVEANTKRLTDFLSPFKITPYGHAAAEVYGSIRSELEKAGNLIGREDLLIAAHAIAADVTLITNNEKEFRRVSGLKVENWL